MRKRTPKMIGLLLTAYSVVLMLGSLCTIAYTDQNIDVYTLQDNVRQLQVGDRWNYDYLQDSVVYKTGAVEVLADTVASPITGDQMSQLHECITYANGNRKHYCDFFAQDSSGTIDYYGYKYWQEYDSFSDTSWNFVTTPTVGFVAMYPSVFYTGLTWNMDYSLAMVITEDDVVPTDIDYSDSVDHSESYTVLGKEIKTVKAGTFETYKVSRTIDGQTSWMWFAPQIGTYVGIGGSIELASVNLVPEPSSIIALFCGISGLGMIVRRRSK